MACGQKQFIAVTAVQTDTLSPPSHGDAWRRISVIAWRASATTAFSIRIATASRRRWPPQQQQL